MDITLTIFAQALAFAGLIWIVATKIWPPLLQAIEERQQKIAEGLAAADRSQKDLAQAQEKVNEALKDARTKANEIIDQAHARANQIIEAAKHEAIAEANRQKDLAQTGSTRPPRVPARSCASRCPCWPSAVPKSCSSAKSMPTPTRRCSTSWRRRFNR